MARDPLRPLLPAVLARMFRRGPRPGSRDPVAPSLPDPRLPEQRLRDASERYGRILAGDGSDHRGTDAQSAGVRTVRATAPADAGAPAWVRRLGEPGGMPSDAPETLPTDPSTGSPSGAARRPRRRA